MKLTNQVIAGAVVLTTLGTAQASDEHIETVIVTATRTEQAIAESLAPVTVFERADIERIQPMNIEELLSRAAGVTFVRSGSRGATTSLFLRGNNSNHSLVMVDGVRIGSATLGSPSFTNLPPELIERVEIVRGPRSSLYGSDAIGGVINIITKKYHDTDGLQPLLSASAGTEGNLRGTAAISGGNARTQANLSLFREETDGIDSTESKSGFHGDKDAFEQTAYRLSLSHKLANNAELYALYQQSDAEADYDADCYGTGFVQYQCAPYNDSSVSVANLRANWRPLESWLLTLSAGKAVDESQTRYRQLDSAAVGVVGDLFKTTRRNYLAQSDWAINKQHIVTLGFEQLEDEVDSTQAYNETSRDNTAGFLQWQGSAGPVDAVIGLRNDDNEQFGDHDTVNASAGVEFAKAYRVIASYGEGFKAPTFNDLYYPFYGNPDLKPETSENIELELRGQHSWGNWSINRFHNDVDDLIQYNPATFGPDQIESAEIEGSEVTVGTSIGGWNLSGNLTLTDATDKRSGKQLRRRPEKQMNLDIDRSWQQWAVGASLRLVGERYEDMANTDTLAGYGLLDGTVSYRFSKQLKLHFTVKNALDKDYVSARSFSLGDYESAGREALLGVTYTP